jgi:hypothetical protein
MRRTVPPAGGWSSFRARSRASACARASRFARGWPSAPRSRSWPRTPTVSTHRRIRVSTSVTSPMHASSSGSAPCSPTRCGAPDSRRPRATTARPKGTSHRRQRSGGTGTPSNPRSSPRTTRRSSALRRARRRSGIGVREATKWWCSTTIRRPTTRAGPRGAPSRAPACRAVSSSSRCAGTTPGRRW